MAERHDERQTHRRDGQCAADHRVREYVGSTDTRASHDAEHGYPDTSRHQGQGAGNFSGRRNLAADRNHASGLPWDEIRYRRADIGGLLRRCAERPRADGAARRNR